ncbi:MAG TPA: hypothetical protein VM364_01045 [Vicinamibacterales bacterium]|nr:hypothetical protein [Vicinamibacterales bacterium]
MTRLTTDAARYALPAPAFGRRLSRGGGITNASSVEPPRLLAFAMPPPLGRAQRGGRADASGSHHSGSMLFGAPQLSSHR